MIALVKKALKDLFIFHYKTLIYLNKNYASKEIDKNELQKTKE
jgi:hypothetical protein